ncbi:barstar family protein [Propionispira raffinosivorans]|uniref:barstar family protein n=1 Tax=Propionispira raffinosivorans TaxID=86959 RepID=UPI00035EFB8C|nr:barstar family protein [Propionispira raffinosivorans]
MEKEDSLYIAEINGNDIQNLHDYLNVVNRVFKFPIPARGLDGYLDWMTDLDWLKKEGYVLIINYFGSFLKNDPNLKSKILSTFIDNILPFWQDEVTRVVVEGKTKSFTVYLID